MSLFEKCEVYLQELNVELAEADFTPDGRILVDSNEEIRKWEFPNVPKPTKEDLDKIDSADIKKLQKKKEKKDKLKRIKQFKFPVLSNEEMLNVTELDDTDRKSVV